eukprot:gene1610-1758_t
MIKSRTDQNKTTKTKTKASLLQVNNDPPPSGTPIINDHDSICDDYEAMLAMTTIDENYLTEVLGHSDFHTIDFLSLTVNSTTQSLFDLPDLLPALQHLVLDNSTIGSIRDLGIGLRCLISLSLSNCGLYDLDGIGVLATLQELNLTDNYLTEVTPLAMHDHLQNLNLGGNKIADLSFGDVLASCPRLRSLFLTRNPVDKAPSYRAIVSYLMPGLEMLDGTPLDTSLGHKVNHGMLLEASAALKIMEEEKEDEDRFESELFEELLPPTVTKSVEIPSLISSLTGNGTTEELIPDTGSELTHGSAVVLAGNAAMAIRKRRTNAAALLSHGKTSYSQEEKEFESTLDILDGALTGRGWSPSSHLPAPAAMKEGDITEILTGCDSPAIKHNKHTSLSLSLEGMGSPSGKNKKHALDSNTSLLSVQGGRPGSAFPGTTLRFSEKDHMKSSSHTPERGQRMETFSPRQRNSSRPQTAAEAGNNNSSLFTSCFLPFVLGVEGQEEGNSRPNSAHRILGRKQQEEDSDEYEDHKTMLNRSKSKGSSIVHLDIVRRNGADSNQLFTEEIGQDRDSDTEDIAVTHKERLQLMSSASNHTNSSLLKSRQSVLMQLRSGEQLPQMSSVSSRPNSAIPAGAIGAKTTIASKAGNSLGFNLAGSLAAIDQWVQDMSSGESDDEADEDDDLDKDELYMKRSASIHPVSSSLLSKATTATHKMKNSRPLSGRREMNGDGADDDDDDEYTPRGSTRILSRDAIFQMCADSQGGKRKAKAVSDESRSTLSSSVAAHSDKPVQLSVRQTVPTETSSSLTSDPPTASKESYRPIMDQHKASLLSKVSKKSSAKHMSDTELIDLLRQPPKTVPALCKKASFQEFFRGLSKDHFHRLVVAAYANLSDPAERDAKVKKRMDLMADALL